MPLLCPFFKSECKEEKCIMWKENLCVIANFLSGVLAEDSESEIIDRTDTSDSFSNRFELSTPVVPEEIKKAAAKDLAKQYIEFMRAEFPEMELSPYARNFDLFLETKYSISRWNSPADIQLKLQKAELLARGLVEKINNDKRKERLDKEKEQLEALVCNCVEWANKNKLPKVTHADMDVFILENSLDLLSETTRTIYSMANLELKRKKN